MYKIKKKNLNSKQIKEIKDELNVKPYVYNDYNNSSNENRFSVYLESPTSLYLPKFYGINKLGPIKNTKEKEVNEINIKFNGDLRSEQIPIENLYLNSAN